jgi:general secretion pathway protein K
MMTRATTEPARRRGERGVALLLVLWIFMILGVLALDFARYMRDDAMASVNLADETRGYYLALAGMNRAIFDAQRRREKNGPGAPPGTAAAAPQGPHTLDEDEEDEGPLVPVDGQWHEGDFAGGRWAVRMIDETGRLSLNKSDEVVLRRVITNLMQVDPTSSIDRRMQDAIDTVVDSILDWRDHDNLKRTHGAESAYYLKRRVPYRAKNAFFDSPEELLLVRGVTPDLYYGSNGVPGLRDIFSVYNRSPKISVDTAPPAVFQALLGLDAAAAADLIAQRDGGEPIRDLVKAQLAAIDPILVALIDDSANPAHLVTIEARGDLASPRNQSHVQVVADLAAPATEGTRIIRWLDRAPWDARPPGAPAAREKS